LPVTQRRDARDLLVAQHRRSGLEDRHHDQPAASVTAGTSASMSVSVEDTYGNLVSSTDSISVA